MLARILTIAFLIGPVMAGCVSPEMPRTTSVKMSVEEQKKDVADLRNRGVITYEEAARRQFEIQRANYTLTNGELSFWRASIFYARQVDRRQITREAYQRQVDEAYRRYVAGTPRGTAPKG